MKAAIYARVSTHNGQNPDMQLGELRSYCERRGWQISNEYVDVGISGTKDRRPRLDALMRDAHAREFDVVLVWKLDRFGRSLRHLVNSLAELESLGVAFVSLRDNLDLSTPAGRMMFHVIGAMAEFERGLICERVRAGLAAARARGKQLGRPAVPVDVEAILRLRAQGASWAKIAAELGVGEGTTRRAAQRAARNVEQVYYSEVAD